MKTPRKEPIRDVDVDLSYDEWLKTEVQEALDDPSPLVPHDEAIRQIRAAIKKK